MIYGIIKSTVCYKAESGIGASSMNVPYEKWGKGDYYKEIYETVNGQRTLVGNIQDEDHSIIEPYVEKVTKKGILSEIEGWKNDDGSYGDNDTVVSIAYNDGTTYYSGDTDKGFKKSGIIGAYLSTPDYQMMWGEDWAGSGNNRHRVKMTNAPSEDFPKEYTNSLLGYKTTGIYKTRVKTTYNNKGADGRYHTKRVTIRKSTVKKV